MSRYNAKEYAARHYESDGSAKSTCYKCGAPSKELLCASCEKFYSLDEPDNMSESVIDFQRRMFKEKQDKEAFAKKLAEKKETP